MARFIIIVRENGYFKGYLDEFVKTDDGDGILTFTQSTVRAKGFGKKNALREIATILGMTDKYTFEIKKYGKFEGFCDYVWDCI